MKVGQPCPFCAPNPRGVLAYNHAAVEDALAGGML